MAEVGGRISMSGTAPSPALDSSGLEDDGSKATLRSHLVGFWIFVALTVYTAIKIPSVVEIPLSALNLQGIQGRLPPAPSLASFRQSLGSQLPKSLTNLELPQLRQLQQSLNNLEMPQLKQLQASLSRVELPRLAELRRSLLNVDLSRRMEALCKSLPAAPSFPALELAARMEAFYDSLPSLPKFPPGALSNLPNMRDMQERAEVYLHSMADGISHLQRKGQEAVSEGFSHFPRMKDMHEAAEPYFAAVVERFSQLPNVHHAAEPFLAAMSERISQNMPKMPDVQGAAEQYLAAAAERLSQLEVLHTLHHLEMLMQGIEVPRLQDAFYSLVSHYACLSNNLMRPTLQDVCPVDGDLHLMEAPLSLLNSPAAPNLTMSGDGDVERTSPYFAAPSPNSCPAPILYSSPTVRWPLFLFLGGAMVCLLLSASCHLLGCVSCEVSRVVWRLDYAGIAALISSSFFPPVFYGFLCQPLVRTIYLSAVLIMGTATVAVSLLPTFQAPEYRHIRAALFFGMGVSGIIPCTHKFLFHYDEPMVITTTLLELLMGALYGIGALFYAMRIPERWLPGKFDIAGHSHQIFHVLVIAGAYTHYCTGMLYLKWRDLHGCGSVAVLPA